MNRPRRKNVKPSNVARVGPAVVAALLITTPAAYWTATADSYGVVKWTILMLGAVALLALFGSDVAARHQVRIRSRRALFPVAAFLVAALTATVLSDSFWVSFLGGYSYYQGLLTFLALAVVFLALLASDDDPGPMLLRAVTIGAGLVALVTAAQFVGIVDQRMYGRVVTTFGNSNFGAAYLGLAVPAALHQAFFSNRSELERWLSGAVAVVAAVESVAIGSSQGPFTLVAAVGAFVILWSLRRHGWKRTGVGVGVASVVGVLGLGVAWTQVSGEVVDSARVGRYGAWVSGWEAFEANPVVGVGLDRYEQVYPALRPEYSAVNEGFGNAGQAHSVPLDLLADGGILLGATYLALVGYTGYRAFKGLRRSYVEDSERAYVLFSAVVAVWIGYQIQSLVSIDHVPLALVHWASMAVILRRSAASVGDAELALGSPGRRSTDPALAYLGIGAVCLVATWFLFIPLRADLAAGEARRLASDGRPDLAAERLETATSLVSFRPDYWTERGLAVQAFRGPEAAAEFIQQGAELNEGNSKSALMLAQFYAAFDQPDAAAQWFEEAIVRDPLNPEVLEPAAEFYDDSGQQDRAEELRLRLSELVPPEG